MRYEHLIRAVLATPWAIDPASTAWAAILDVLSMRASGERLTDSEIQARIEAAANGPRSGRARSGNVAILPVYGIISPRATLMSAMSGGTTAESLSADFAAAMADPEVSGVVLDVDSPGGAVEGIHELAEQIRAARGGDKPIVAVANHTAASAAYWIAAAADEVVVTPSGQVGSIGIISAHEDLSEADAKAGRKTTLITAGKFKGEGWLGPLSDEAIADRQTKVNAFYRTFTTDVAHGRKVGVDAVRSGYGEGRSVLAKDALDAGMVDRVDTLDNTVRRVARGMVGSGSAEQRAAVLAAALASPQLVATHEAIGGVLDPAPDADEQDADGAPSPPPPTDGDDQDAPDDGGGSEEAEPSARALPARQRQLALHSAALRVGLTLGQR